MKYYQYSFEKLEVWQLARKLRVDIYKVCEKFPHTEQYNLTSQMKRAIGSISTNLAEGSGRKGPRDKSRFTNTSYSSALEMIDHFIASYDLGYMDFEHYENLRIRMDEIINKLNALYKYQHGS
ncbi:MAG: four helix bundle protein [Bacteroidia bacterium]